MHRVGRTRKPKENLHLAEANAGFHTTPPRILSSVNGKLLLHLDTGLLHVVAKAEETLLGACSALSREMSG